MRQMKAAVWDGGAQVRLVQKEVPVIEHPHEESSGEHGGLFERSLCHGAVPGEAVGAGRHEMVGTIVQCAARSSALRRASG
ncbi:MAG: hypothetical protein ACLTCB_07070 [Merdibacter sp.]